MSPKIKLSAAPADYRSTLLVHLPYAHGGPYMKRSVYSAESLSRALGEFERHFGLSSAEFYDRHLKDEELSVPRFEQHVWASFYEDVTRLSQEGEVMGRVSESFAVPA